MKKLSMLDVYYLFKQSYEKDDGKLLDYDFVALMAAMDEFGLKLSMHQKEQIGERLYEKYESEVEEYNDYLIKCERESMEEDIAKDAYYNEKYGG